jgi:hypothetical protein
MPPAARNPFEKGFLDLPKLLINKKFLRGGSRGGQFFQKAPPLAAGGKNRRNTNEEIDFCSYSGFGDWRNGM